ncbi:hypothetical protein SAY87_024994 [Trapa incisa]|uniref:Uncharacterized protein n=1 Tax=Trapa incisa TaxID=236973 RepID=A0AAN7GDT2_9MYRT|nr:hypothetical protein SAY87_024994 [Trapa incisa]
MFAVMDSEWHDKSSRPQKKLHLEGTLGNESSNDFNPRFDPDINTSESFSSDRSSRNSGAITPTFNPFAPYEDLRAPTSLVSSSSAASSDDLFQVIPTPATKPHINVHSTGALDIQSKASSNDHVSSDSSAKSDDTEVGSSSGPAPASTDPNISYEPRLHTLSPTQSPPVQNMDRSGDLEPYRIPSSEFTMSKSPFPADWSIASNDSLFSIQLGDNSFSRDNSFKGDHDIMWGDDLLSPSELLKSSELMEKTANNTDRLISSSRHSDESGTSVQSFTFPILTDHAVLGSLAAHGCSAALAMVVVPCFHAVFNIVAVDAVKKVRARLDDDPPSQPSQNRNLLPGELTRVSNCHCANPKRFLCLCGFLVTTSVQIWRSVDKASTFDKPLGFFTPPGADPCR